MLENIIVVVGVLGFLVFSYWGLRASSKYNETYESNKDEQKAEEIPNSEHRPSKSSKKKRK